ncbi:MAG: hypothetical protein KKE76_13670 [Gammaproteobacteria bacterium]|nr:hypothetical protein [Gammaproteobacteria bacterium]
MSHTDAAYLAGLIDGEGTIERHTPSFTYAIYNRQALNLLEQIHPYLRTYKSKRANIILEHYLALTPRNGKYSEEQRRMRGAFEQRVLETKPIG